MTKTIYIETSIIGYLTARPSKNLIVAANAELTRDWWDNQRNSFTIYISPLVLQEVAKGDAEMVNKRLEVLNNFPLLDITESVQNLAQEFQKQSNLPPSAAYDTVYIATATVYGLDYLLTWNCKHIANAQIQKKLAQVSLDFGYEMPTICTPYELMER
jgi:predicted nucleic acid-binding protein